MSGSSPEYQRKWKATRKKEGIEPSTGRPYTRGPYSSYTKGTPRITILEPSDEELDRRALLSLRRWDSNGY